MSLPRVSVIILNFNGAEHLPICLESLLAQTYPHLEIIVADNGSTDDSAAICAAFERVIFVPLGRNWGFGLGNNLGARQAQGEYLLFLNNDMRFSPDFVSNLVAVAKDTPNLFALDAKQYTWDGAQVGHAASGFCKPGWGGRRFLPGVEWIQFDADEVIAVPMANGASLFCLAERFHELGGFDPSFFLHWEDTDLCWRARLRGWKILYVPQAYSWHKISVSKQHEIGLSRRFEDVVRFSIWRNRYRFIAKTMSTRRNLGVFGEFAYMLTRLLLRGRWALAHSLLAAYWDAVGKFWEVQAYRKCYGGAEDGRRSEDILREFWLEDEQLSKLESEGRIVR